jgi:hypothetical protein
MVDLKEKADGAIEQLYAYDKCFNESSDKSKVSVCLVKPSKINFLKLCQLGNICCTCFFLLKVFVLG